MQAEYKELFLEELEEQLQLMDEEILKLEQEGESEQVVQSLFRAAHTLKGSSAAMGFEDIKLLTHEMEQLLDQVRNKAMAVTVPLIDLLFKSMDGLKKLRQEIMQSENTTTDISEYVKSLQAFGGNSKAAAPTGVSGSSKPVLSLDSRLKIEEAHEQGLKVHWIRMQISSECVIKGARAYVAHSKLSELGEVMLSSPDMDGIDEHSAQALDLAFLYAGNQGIEEIRAFVSDLIEIENVRVEPLEADETALINPQAAVQDKPVHDEQVQAGKSKSQTIRVSVERLDHLMNLVGELVIDQTRIHEVERIQNRKFSDESVDDLGVISDHLSRIIGDLQETVMKTRMLPIEQLFNRFPRMIRDLSRDLGKEMDLVIEGKDTELDRTLIEEIADPLIHLIRNAVDHGLEKPDIREQSHKNPKGIVIIRAAHEDNQVVIYVEDDGAGIDPAKMKKSALEKGIISSEEAEQLSEREAIHLIFHPGFSTANVVSDVSGRGVGMDIVRSHIEKLNGLIDIETKLGEGTSFKIKLPLTLAIIVGLLVKLDEQTFIIPMSNISEIVRVSPDEIKLVRGQSVILLRNQIIPIAWLHDHFNMPNVSSEKNHIPLVVVGAAEKRLALAVDELLGNQEIVIKSLGSYIGKVDSIAGATILGDGKVALILEIGSMLNKIGAAKIVSMH